MIATRRITYADGVPVSFGALYHGVARLRNSPDLLKVLDSVSQVYKACGIEDYIRGNTSLHARLAKTDEAKNQVGRGKKIAAAQRLARNGRAQGRYIAGGNPDRL